MGKQISSKDVDVDKIMGSLQEFGSPIPGASVSSLPQLIATERRMCSAAESRPVKHDENVNNSDRFVWNQCHHHPPHHQEDRDLQNRHSGSEEQFCIFVNF